MMTVGAMDTNSSHYHFAFILIFHHINEHECNEVQPFDTEHWQPWV